MLYVIGVLFLLLGLAGGLFYGYAYLKAKVNKTTVDAALLNAAGELLKKDEKGPKS